MSDALNQYLSRDYDLTRHNTFGLSARSSFARAVRDEAELPSLFTMADRAGLSVRLLGGGSNVILSENYAGITAMMATSGLRQSDDGAGATLIEAHAGESWHRLVAHAVGQGLWGLENLAGIPGTVGAAVVQNIGAYGVELSDRFVSLRAFDRSTRAFIELAAPACRFAYRQSLFKQEKGRYVVTLVRLKVSRAGAPNLSYGNLSAMGDPDDPGQIMAEVLRLRARKLPDWRLCGNAGSFFHNPLLSDPEGRAFMLANPGAPAFSQADGWKLSAGWLIEQAGLKGYRRGRAGVSDQHALVLVNHGGATCSDILDLAEHVANTVRDRFGISLQREPELL